MFLIFYVERVRLGHSADPKLCSGQLIICNGQLITNPVMINISITIINDSPEPSLPDLFHAWLVWS